MERVFEHVKVEFNDGASKLFYFLYQKFEDSVSLIDRRKYDNLFYQLRGKYIFTLKNQLNKLANELIEKIHPSNQTLYLNKLLSDGINTYVDEFMYRSRCL